MSNFAQLAMEESRTAFSSIESIIQTFRSISNMFESTFTNVYTSCRARTDLFDHFIRKFFHLRKKENIEDSRWIIYNNFQENTESTKITNGQSSRLFIGLFFLVSFGTLMLMLKFFNSIIKKTRKVEKYFFYELTIIRRILVNNNWLQQETNQARVIALYDYVVRNSDELSFTGRKVIYLAPSVINNFYKRLSQVLL